MGSPYFSILLVPVTVSVFVSVCVCVRVCARAPVQDTVVLAEEPAEGRQVCPVVS